MKSVSGFCVPIRYVIILLCFVLVDSHKSLSAQRTANNTEDNWKLAASQKNVFFYYKLSDCKGRKVVFLRFNNKNKYPVTIKWNEIFSTQAGPRLEGYGGQKTMVLSSGEIQENSCDKPKNKKLLILPELAQPTYVAKFESFDFVDIEVSKNL